MAEQKPESDRDLLEAARRELREHTEEEEKRLTSIDSSIERIGVAQEHHVRQNTMQHDAIQNSLQVLRESAYGRQGKGGFEQRLSIIEAGLADIQEIKKLVRKGVFAVITGIGTGFIGLIYWIVKTAGGDG